MPSQRQNKRARGKLTLEYVGDLGGAFVYIKDSSTRGAIYYLR